MAERLSVQVRLLIAEMLEAGMRQVDIAARVGVSQSVVSQVKKAVLLGHGPREEISSAVPVQRRTRSQILVEGAALKADTIRAAARALLDVVEADEWVTEPGFAADLADASGSAVVEALGCLTKLSGQLQQVGSPTPVKESR